jgi:hypothetical protein
MIWSALKRVFETSAPAGTTERRALLGVDTLGGRILPSTLHVTLQPESVIVGVHSLSLTLDAQATGGPTTPTVQWQEKIGGTFVDISGATRDQLRMPVPAAPTVEEFRAVFTSGTESVVTDIAVVKFEGRPLDPTNPTAHKGDTGNLAPSQHAWQLLNNGWQP